MADHRLSYWKSQLADCPEEIALPYKGPPPVLPPSRGESINLELGRELSSQLRAFADRQGATLFMTLLAGFRALLARYSGQDDIAIGTSIPNNTRDINLLVL